MSLLFDQLVRSKRRTIAIIVRRDGKVIVRAPLKASETLIKQFVESKAAWIAEKKAEAALHPVLTARQFSDGETLPFLGREIPMRVVDGPAPALRFDGVFHLAKKARPGALSLFEKWYKAQARRILTERVELYARQFGFRYGQIRISSARTRWGSCSSRGTLSFTWRLVMAPLDVVDYVVLHELAHLKVRNHSPLFWAEVARMLPGYRQQVAWLRKNGRLLTLDGE